jgi:hypothetical protein
MKFLTSATEYAIICMMYKNSRNKKMTKHVLHNLKEAFCITEVMGRNIS